MRFLRLSALGLLLTLAACSSSDDKKADPTPATPAAGLRWTEGGTTYTATRPLYTATGNGLVSVTGSYTASGTTRSIGLTVPQAVGTYDLTAAPTGALTHQGMYTVVTGSNVGIYYASGSQGSGTVTISSVSATNVVGTFAFRADSNAPVTSKTISEGQFNITK